MKSYVIVVRCCRRLFAVSVPISLRLDEDVQVTLETEVEARGIDLSSYLGQISRHVQREQIRRQSKLVSEYVACEREAAAFYDDWGTPRSEGP
jgi:hypothetical protein